MQTSVWKMSLLTGFVVIGCCLGASAQFSVGVEGGYYKNYLITNNANRAFTNFVPLSGISIGVPVQYRFFDWLAVVADPSFIQKNYRQERSSFFAGVYQENYNNYIQLPITGRVLFGGDRLKGFIDAGVYGAYWMSSKTKGVNSNILDIPADNNSTNSIFDFQSAYSYNEKYTFDNKKDNRYEFGWIGGLGAGYDITPRINVFAEARLMYSFTDMQKPYMTNQVPRYNTTYGGSAGVLYHFGAVRTTTSY